MYKKSSAFLFAAAIGLAVIAPAQAALPTADSQGQELPSLAPMLEKTVPGIVNIATRTRVPVQQNPLLSDPFFRHFFDVPAQPSEQYAQSLGSGVVVDADKGYILTNNHVIDHADEITVHLGDGRTVPAKLIGTDPDTDIAVVQVKTDKLTEVKMSDSDKLRVGDFVVAIGNPFGLNQTVTSGIVSAIGRSGLGIEGYEDFIQTDASINPGNSGGALVNLRGELVGINTAILSQSGGNVGIGFAIPINMVKSVMTQLIQHGEVRRGQLGAQAQDLTPELASAFGITAQHGAVVTQVTAGSPAAKAGLKSGDVIVRINGRTMRDSSDVRNTIGLLPVGEQVKLDVMRNGKEKTVIAKIERPKATTLDGDKLYPRLAGAVIGNIVEGMPWYGKIDGVVVLEATPGSPAWRAGLRKGDVIVQANRRDVTNIDTLQAAINKKAPLLLNVQRRDGALFLLLQ